MSYIFVFDFSSKAFFCGGQRSGSAV